MPSKLLTGEAASSAPCIEWTAAVRIGHAPLAVPLYGSPAVPGSEPVPEARLWEAERNANDAYQRGFQEGQAAGAKAAQDMQACGEQLARAVEAIGSYRARIRSEAEHDLVKLSLAIARRLVHRELQVDPDALLGLVKAALERTGAGEIHRVRLSPAHAGIVRRHLERSGRGIEVVDDPALDPGAAIVETSRGQIDAGLETQLSEIERGFTDLLPS